MTLNLCIDRFAITTVDMSSLLNTYVIDAIAGTTYTYNLPTGIDGQEFTLIRTDGTTGIVNLVGNITLGGTSRSSIPILPYSTITVMSVNKLWNVMYNGANSSTNIVNVFSSFFIGNNSIPYISVSPKSSFLSFPYLGTSSSLSIGTIVSTFGNPITATSADLKLYNSTGILLCTINLPVKSTSVIYNLTNSERSNLPTKVDYLYVVYTGSGSIDISSLIVYA